jgi:ribosome-binding ATPase YchF (GTP1/OBG family)
MLLKKELNSAKPARSVITDEQDRLLVQDLHLLSMKPELFVSNISESQVQDVMDNNGTIQQSDNTIFVCAKVESEVSALSESEQKEYLASLGWDKSGLDRLIQKAYSTLGLISFLTIGVKESRAWTIKTGTKAPQAAGVIHTDFEKKFIRADVVRVVDFVACLGWKGARDAGKVRSEGRDYVLRDGDVIEFKIGT